MSPISSVGNDSGSGEDFKEKNLAAKTTGADITPGEELEANAQLRNIKKKHQWDPNFSEELEEELAEATADHDINGELRLVDELVENSPYPEVRAAVRNVSISLHSPSQRLKFAVRR